MKYNIKFCEHCYRDGKSLSPSEECDEYYAGYMVYIRPEKISNTTICPLCNTDGLIETNITEEELNCIGEVSNYNRQLLGAMRELKQKDIIEYELKMSQFRMQVSQQKAVEEKQEDNAVKCPYCKSLNVEKISAASRVGSAMMFGILSKKIGKNYHCNNCKSDF